MNDIVALRCAEVAEAVFPHNNWRNERDRLTAALIALFDAAEATQPRAAIAKATGGAS
ncbi:MAG: hypothetical protein WA940_09155 [Sphingopyxis sp.]